MALGSRLYFIPGKAKITAVYITDGAVSLGVECKIHDAAELVLVIDTERNICELVWLSLASINFYILSRLAAEMGRG